MQNSADVTRAIFLAGSELKAQCARDMATTIAGAAELMINCLRAGGKILSCGNGGSAADAQHFSSEMLNRFDRDRSGFAAIALTTDASTVTSIANDYDFSQIFAKQINALGRPGDALLVITTSGNSPNLSQAIHAAHQTGLKVVLLSGRDGGDCAKALNAQDAELRVPSRVTARIQEIHLTIIHCLCELIDRDLLGELK